MIEHGITRSKIPSIYLSSKLGTDGLVQISLNSQLESNSLTFTEVAFSSKSKCARRAFACNTEAFGSFDVCINSWCVDESTSPNIFRVYLSSSSNRPPSA